MKRIILLSFASVLMLLTSCKDKEEITPTKTQTELLMHNGAAWRLAAATVDPAYPYNGTLITNYFDQLKDCYKDDDYLYSANPITATNGSLILKNPIKCDNAEQSQYLGTWEISGGNLITTFGGNSSTESIIELNATNLKTKSKITENGVNYNVTWIYQ